ncbi:hypothetical protein C8J57DRAFT_1248859 [Mycena rebaudengoi]|nr:hypothetical protein C8J57DRAFT_1248859 [Mycena rebaudengoi]
MQERRRVKSTARGVSEMETRSRRSLERGTAAQFSQRNDREVRRWRYTGGRGDGGERAALKNRAQSSCNNTDAPRRKCEEQQEAAKFDPFPEENPARDVQAATFQNEKMAPTGGSERHSIMGHTFSRKWCLASGFESCKSGATGLGIHGGGGASRSGSTRAKLGRTAKRAATTLATAALDWHAIGRTADDAGPKFRRGACLRVSSEGVDGMVRSLAQPGAQKRSQKLAVTKKYAGSAVLDGERGGKGGDGGDVP